jgi:probable rRNA maturation factor
LLEELQLLVVHGTLHLLGYDHASGSEKEKMQASQDKILDQLGIHSIGKL